ncbi:MAG: hypothetical protein KAU90_09070 [Sulfurovaceae bacterium]|nr:hypothetical protein [Sulfurovaceae bacterium]
MSYQQQQYNQIHKTMNATIVTGEYTNRAGEKKKSYLTIGKLFIYQNGGMSLKLDVYPANGQNINFYDIKPKPQSQPPQQNNNQRYNTQNPPPNYNNR